MVPTFLDIRRTDVGRHLLPFFFYDTLLLPIYMIFLFFLPSKPERRTHTFLSRTPLLPIHLASVWLSLLCSAAPCSAGCSAHPTDRQDDPAFEFRFHIHIHIPHPTSTGIRFSIQGPNPPSFGVFTFQTYIFRRNHHYIYVEACFRASHAVLSPRLIGATR